MNQNIISEAIKYIEELFKENADGHDAAHTMRVYKNAERLAASYPESDREIILLSALLHDVDDHKLFDTKNNENARRFLEENGVEEPNIERICAIINAVSFSKNRGKRPETIEGQIVQDADRLDALGAIGIARTFAYGGKHQRSLDDSVKHFYEKLFLLKDEMNTKEAKEMAEERHKFMEEFVGRFKGESEGESKDSENKE